MMRTAWRPTVARSSRVVLRLGTIVLGADDVDRAVAFWADVFGYEVVRFPDSDDDFTILVPPDRVGTRIAVHRSVSAAQERPRVHLDLVVDSAAEQSVRDRSAGGSRGNVPWPGTTPATLTSWCWPTPKATASASSTPATADGFGAAIAVRRYRCDGGHRRIQEVKEHT